MLRGIKMDKKQILIVDDELDVLSVLRSSLDAEGYCVTTVTSAKSLAIALVLTNLPDLIILDIGLPDINGREIAVGLKENPKTSDIPILFLSALYSHDDNAENDGLLDGNVLLTKPYEMEEMLGVIEELLAECENVNDENSEEMLSIDDKTSVLVIEDEDDVRTVLECCLKSDGFDVHSATNGADGLEIACETVPDVILLDWVMPKMSGLEVLVEIRRDERTQDIIVLMLTAKNMVDDSSMALARGADDYIIKPFEGADLGGRIMSIVGAIKKQREGVAGEGKELAVSAFVSE